MVGAPSQTSSALRSIIADEVRDVGSMTIARFMELSLYHPEFGYYSAGPERTGWRGHFLTSSELDAAFGELWARGFEAIWESCGRPSLFDVVEVGPGEGGFAAALLASAHGDFAAALHLRLVERSGALRARQARRLGDSANAKWHASMDEVPDLRAGCIFANEVLDNQPVHVVERRGRDIFEVIVRVEGTGFTTDLAPAGEEVRDWLTRAGVDLGDGNRIEVGLAAEELVRGIATKMQAGAVILCDYGIEGSDVSAHSGGTIMCYSSSGIDDDFLDAPGDKDITSHVNWNAIAAALAGAGLETSPVVSQRTVLKRLGIHTLDAELRRVSGGGGVAAVRAMSRRGALGALSDPGGLGSLGVLAGVAGIELPAFLVADDQLR